MLVTYKRKSIMAYALKENLKVLGWSLEPMSKIRRTKKTMEPDMFDM